MEEIEALYRLYAPAVLRFSIGLTGSVSRAEDLVSETFLRCMLRAPQIRTETALAYLLAIARNTFVSGLRRSRREAPLPEDLASDARSPTDQLHAKDALSRLERAIPGLPEGERSALLMKVSGDLSYEDIAAALGISVVAAKVRVHRARQRLARTLAEPISNQEGEQT
jgi:RNA polymerase sigma-70 factor (ECF subfamily)